MKQEFRSGSLGILVFSLFVAGCACSDEEGEAPPPSPSEEHDCRLSGDCPVAPELDRTVATTVTEAARFLYEGDNPLQKDVDVDALDPRRIAVVRGTAQDAEGKPAAGVKISVLGHPEFGWTLSRADGAFDMAVHGGGRLVFVYEADGLLRTQRAIQPAWQRYARLPTVGLVAASEKISRVRPSSGATAEAEIVEDEYGSRKPLVVFEPGTTATAHLGDGGRQELEELNLRITEYPFRADFEETARFAPGTPPTSGLHYGLSFRVAEADEIDAQRVTFDQPAALYVENFLRLKTGSRAPLGYYNEHSGQWEQQEPAWVIEILGEKDGRAEVDVDGDGTADDPSELQITDAELVALARHYEPGQSLWRGRLEHFSDYLVEFPLKPPPTAGAPSVSMPRQRPLEQPSVRGPVLVETQALAQSVPITGTPFSLHYQSDRTTAYGPGFQLEIPLIGDEVPEGLTTVLSVVRIANQEFMEYFTPEPNLRHVVVWDGRDAWGRLMQGQQKAEIVIGYAYPGHLNLAAFGLSGALDAEALGFDLPPAILWQTFEVPVGVWDSAGYDLGGFSIDALHAYDPVHQTLHFGNGHDKRSENVALVVKQLAQESDLGRPDTLAVAPDGSVLLSDDRNGRILRVASDQTVTVVAGSGAAGAAGELRLDSPQGVAIAGDGSIWVADYLGRAIYAIHPDGSVETITGKGSDDPRIEIDLDDLEGIAFGLHDELYLTQGNEVLRLMGDSITPFAGGGTLDAGAPATKAELKTPSGVAVAPDGTVYISERYGHRVRKVTPDGGIHDVAGNGEPGFSGDGGSATKAQLDEPRGLALDDDGSLYIADYKNGRIRRVTPDGLIYTVVGGGEGSFEEGQLALETHIEAPDGIALGKDGALYIASPEGLYKVSPGMPELTTGENLVPSRDGRTLYRFDHRGKHLETIDAMTGVVLLSLEYDELGRLSALVDRDGLVTQLERGASGLPETIVAPFGQKTKLAFDEDRILSKARDPLGREVAFSYDNGVLETSTESVTNGMPSDAPKRPDDDDQEPPRRTFIFKYDPLNRLISVTDPTGYRETYHRHTIPGGFSVEVTTPAGRSSEYRIQSRPGGTLTRTVVEPDGVETSLQDDILVLQGATPDGTNLFVLQGADPLFGPQSTYPGLTEIVTPSGRMLEIYTTRGRHLREDGNNLNPAQWTEVKELNGKYSQWSYDADVRTMTTTSAMGRTSTTVYDEKGRPIEYQVPGLATTSWEYDEWGRPTAVTRRAGNEQRVQTFGYGHDGLLAAATNSLQQTTAYTRDPAGRLKELTRPDGGTIAWTLDDDDNVLSLLLPHSKRHTFNYTPNSLLASYEPPALPSNPEHTGISTYTYTEDLELSTIARSDGERLSFEYDETTGRLLSTSFSDATLTYGYDDAGRITSIGRSDGVDVSLEFDGPLWMSTTWSDLGTVAADYDENFWLSSLQVGNVGTISFDYDDDGLLTSASAGGAVLTLERDPDAGLVESTTLGNVPTFHAYNAFGELIDVGAEFQEQVGFRQRIQRDELGRVTSIVETIGSQVREITYRYDELGQLVEEESNGVVTSYTYDANGNRTSEAIDGFEVATATYDDQDRILTYGPWTFEQTPHGDLQRRTDGIFSLELRYDALGNLLAADLADGTESTSIEYVIDGLGRRVGRLIDGYVSRTWFYQDELRPVAEVNDQGEVSIFVYATGGVGGAPDFLLKDGEPYRIVKDHLGSVRLVVHAESGEVVQELEYDAFGRVLFDSMPGFQPFGFAGGLYDWDTGLVRFGARDYDPETGRWTSKDPILFRGGQGNLYVYVGNDPVNFVDETGTKKTSVLRKAWRALNGTLRFGPSTTLKNVLKHLEREEGVWVSSMDKAKELAREYSILKGGKGDVKFHPGHTLDKTTGKLGYAHFHALAADGRTFLPGHFWFARIGTLAMILDITGDGRLDELDLFEWFNPNLFIPIPTSADECADCI